MPLLLRSLELTRFRNLEHARLELAEGFTVLWGHNGAGKTNVLEALYLLATLRSFRTTDLSWLVQTEAPAASVTLQAYDEQVALPTTLQVQLARTGSGVRRSAHADGKLVRSAIDFYGRLRAVLFTPDDLAVLRESPSQRRQFLDRMLFARERAHIADVQDYERLVRSRNSVLRDESLTASTREPLLDAYESQLAQVGARIWSRRERLLDELAPGARASFAAIHGRPGVDPAQGAAAELGLSYAARLGTVAEPERAGALAARLRERRVVDRDRGATTVGPHRDDVLVRLDDRPVGEFASQGQTRAIVLALKLAELGLADQAGARPLLLLDDVGSELDPLRTAALFARLAEVSGQCVITTTAREFVRLPPSGEHRFWAVERGVVRATPGPAGPPAEP
ncbi:MAG: DNA replication and repair protein RecF [Nannocystaceae bacterium]|nr:DNA replication and repair protein RecF [Nannocystaceae bacterium]